MADNTSDGPSSSGSGHIDIGLSDDSMHDGDGGPGGSSSDSSRGSAHSNGSHAGSAPADSESIESEDEAPRRKTGDWYYRHRNRRLYAGSEMRLVQVVWLLMQLKQEHLIKDNCFDKLCRIIQGGRDRVARL